MDGLSAATSAITVASIAFQLSESIKKLFEFWMSIKNAPDDIHAITTDLQILSSVLDKIAFEAQRLPPDTLMIAALNSCSGKIQKLSNIVDDLESGFRSTSSSVRKWSALKAVFKSDRIKKFQDSLERTKSTLMLIQNIHQGIVICSQHDVQRRSTTKMTNDVSALNLKYSSDLVSTFSSVPSDIRDHTKALETEISRVANKIPSPVCRSLFEFGMNNALQEILSHFGCVSSNKEMEPTDVHILRRERESSDSTVNYATSKKPFWIKRNMRRNDFVLKSFIGKIYVRLRTNVLEYSLPIGRLKDGENVKYEHVTSLCACPAPWLVKIGVNYGLNVEFHKSAIWGWKHALSTIRLVPDDAMIFEFCKEGNLSGVQTLLSGGRASVRDTDSCGKTPLFYAAANHRSQLCKLLISEGADKNARIFQGNKQNPWYPITPVMAASCCNGREGFKPIECIDTVRLFSDCIDFYDLDSDGWYVLFSQEFALIRGDARHIAAIRMDQYQPLLWILSSFGPELKDNFNEGRFATMLRWNLIHQASDEVTRSLFRINKNLVDAKESPNGYSVLQFMITSGSNSPAQGDHAIELLLENGANPHLVGFDPHYSSRPETPSSLALYTSSTFIRWRDALKRIPLDFEAFVEDELQRGPLKDAGWRQDTLLALFRQDFRSGADPQYKHEFVECEHLLSALIVEPCWLHWLQRFKDRMNIDPQPERKWETNSNNNSQGRIVQGGLDSVRIDNFTDEEFECLENVETSTDEVYDHEPEHDECFHVKPHDNPALFEDGSVRPRLACIRCWSKNKSIEWVSLRGSATPSSPCTRGQDFLPISTIPKRFRRR